MKNKILSKDRICEKSLSRRAAIREKCLNCAGWSPKDAKECSFEECQLYLFRLGKGKQDAKIRSKAIKAYCLWCCIDVASEVRKCSSVTCPLHVYRKG